MYLYIFGALGYFSQGGSNGLGASLAWGAGLWKSGRGIFGVACAKDLFSSPVMGGVVIVAANPRLGKFKIDSVAIETVDRAERKLSLRINLGTNFILLIIKGNNRGNGQRLLIIDCLNHPTYFYKSNEIEW